MQTITMLGTGYATATQCYNTCFLLQDDTTKLLVDAGGGNIILQQLQRVNIELNQIHYLFITHAHTDHILGAVWVLRMIMQQIRQGKYTDCLHVYGNDKAMHVLDWICRNTLPAKLVKLLNDKVLLHTLTDGENFSINDWNLTAFDIHSTKEKQYGFRLVFPNNKTLVCLGDEPYNEDNKLYVEHADWLLSEAFCLNVDADIYHPYEKHHSTTLDAAQLAQKLQTKNLLLYHTEDKTLNTRKVKYTEEAKKAFSGNVFVPNDLETIHL